MAEQKIVVYTISLKGMELSGPRTTKSLLLHIFTTH